MTVRDGTESNQTQTGPTARVAILIQDQVPKSCTIVNAVHTSTQQRSRGRGVYRS